MGIPIERVRRVLDEILDRRCCMRHIDEDQEAEEQQGVGIQFGDL